jgi:cytochrome c-type biogenesis protein CcmE
MRKKTRNKLLGIFFGLAIISLGVWFILNSLSENILFFYPPSSIPLNKYDKLIRVGGLVKDASVKKINIETVNFILIDNKSEIIISYKGILPSLFREKQGIVAKGIYDGKIFYAESLLAKHDETYKPK